MFISLPSPSAPFRVAVPTGQTARARRTLEQDGVARSDLLRQEGHDFDEFAHAPRARRQARRADADALVVPLVDDDRDVREGMHHLLERRLCRVIVVGSAAEARLAVLTLGVGPDTIVTEHRLRDGPSGDGAIADVHEEVIEEMPALKVTADTSFTPLRETSAGGFGPPHEPLVPEEPFDAIGELAGREDP